MMDPLPAPPDLAALASTAAGRLISVLTTDGWTAVKSSIVALWRHTHPDRAGAHLDEARDELLSAGPARSRDLEALLAAEWQARLAALLATRPEAAEEIRRLLLRELSGGDTADRQEAHSTTLNAHVSDGGDAYLAGRDMTIAKGQPS